MLDLTDKEIDRLLYTCDVAPYKEFRIHKTYGLYMLEIIYYNYSDQTIPYYTTRLYFLKKKTAEEAIIFAKLQS